MSDTSSDGPTRKDQISVPTHYLALRRRMDHLQADDMGHTSGGFVHYCSYTMVGMRYIREEEHAFGPYEVCIVWPGL